MDVLTYFKILIEILILWYSIYMVLLFVKGTRTEQLLKGLLIIGVIFVLAQQLQLEAISWLLTRLFPISVIALAVIFQPELRRALAQLGQLGLHQDTVEAIDEIATAAITLARRRTGSLVVIEREVGLKSYIDSGVPLDARISSSLLVALFLPQSPLHDGAVIIQSGRIVAAACVLPLTQEEKGYVKSHGMRHRAAVGVTEETDAVCIVVSEETGGISITAGGKLTDSLSGEELIASLKKIFASPESRKKRFFSGSFFNRKH